MQATLAVSEKHVDPTPVLTPESIVEGVEDLLSLPDAAMRLNALLVDPDASAREIAEVVTLDVGLSARVLRVVNSSYFGLRTRVDTISKAVSMIGTSELHSIVLTTSAAQAFKNISYKLMDMETFWQHSVRAALAARGLAETSLKRHRERVFLAALMHDIGKLVLYHQVPGVSARILEAVGQGHPQEAVEFALLGFSHADVGSVLLERWNLPTSLTVPVRYHHRFAEAPEYLQEAALINLGTRIADYMESEVDARDGVLPDAEEAWSQSGCSPEELEEVVAEVDMNWLQVIEIVAPGSLMIY